MSQVLDLLTQLLQVAGSGIGLYAAVVTAQRVRRHRKRADRQEPAVPGVLKGDEDEERADLYCDMTPDLIRHDASHSQGMVGGQRPGPTEGNELTAELSERDRKQPEHEDGTDRCDPQDRGEGL